MLRIMQNGASGMLSQALKVDVLSNNLANITTTAFKARRANLADLPYRYIARAGMPVYQSLPAAQVGCGTTVTTISPDFTQGVPVETGDPWDLAIVGEGFLAVEMEPGKIAYTRDGQLAIRDGRVVHAGSGYPLAGNITVPEETQAVTITPDGRLMAHLNGGAIDETGRIELCSFPNPQGLEAISRNLWLAGDSSGEPEVARPGREGMGELKQGRLEASNVDLAEQMVEMFLAQRAYQLNARSVATADEMWALANELRR